MKPSKLGTILPMAKIKYIDDSGSAPKWVTVAECIDAPKHIQAALTQARKMHAGKAMWVHPVYGKEMA